MRKKAVSHWQYQTDFGKNEDIPGSQKHEDKYYKLRPDRGRKLLPKRQVLEGVVYVLRTVYQRKTVPKEYRVRTSILTYFQEWTKTRFFEKNWAKSLEKHDELEEIDYEWQSLDGCMVKAPLAFEAVGHNPTDSEKNRNKTKSTNGWKRTSSSRCTWWR